MDPHASDPHDQLLMPAALTWRLGFGTPSFKHVFDGLILSNGEDSNSSSFGMPLSKTCGYLEYTAM
jgi:hypothetical protein